MDVAVLLLPTETPLTGIEFTRRLPCGKHEKTRRVSSVHYIISLIYCYYKGPQGVFCHSPVVS